MMEKGKNNGNNDKEMNKVDGEESETDSNQRVSGEGNSDSQNDEKLSKMLKEIFLTDEMRFMSNFDPGLSNREKRKMNRKTRVDGGRRSAALYDENGILKGVGKDLCDCLNELCPGCHFPCPKCRSCKCGYECRVNRKWMVESIENEGD